VKYISYAATDRWAQAGVFDDDLVIATEITGVGQLANQAGAGK
jgi:hypothetical protein